MFGAGRGATTPERLNVTKPPEPMEEGHGECQDTHRVLAPVKKKRKYAAAAAAAAATTTTTTT
jgi:hypothetical protein